MVTGWKAVLAVFVLGVFLCAGGVALAASAAEIDRDVTMALEMLYDTTPAAKTLGAQAKGILVFPSIVKGGFLVGAQYGEGALLKGGKTVAYFFFDQKGLMEGFGLQGSKITRIEK